MKLGHCDTGVTDYALFRRPLSVGRICDSSLPVELRLYRTCIPDDHGFPAIEHAGFAGVEREACQAFFKHFELEPPISHILQPRPIKPTLFAPLM